LASDPSMEQTAAGLATTKGIEGDLRISKAERRVLRDLASRVAELAARPIEKEKALLWKQHNDLEEVRPPIFCDPENGWNEIVTQNQILCVKPLFRVWEMALRKEIFWGAEMGDDRVIEPYFNVPYSYTDSEWGIAEVKIGGEHGGAYMWEAPISDYERDFPRICFPSITVDYDTTRKIVDLAEDILCDILPVRLRGNWWWTLGLTWDFVRLRGLNDFMLDMYDNPDWVHKMMKFLSDGILAKLDFLEANGLLSLNTEGSYVGSGGFGWTSQLPQEDFNAAHVRTIDMWGFAESQETVGISPDMFAEFVFPYQLPILERFGLNCYGCCEPIDPRWHVVRKLPRLRRVSTSPWADRRKMAQLLGKEYIISLKPSPTPLAEAKMPDSLVREGLHRDLLATKGCRVELIMKDNHTLGGNPDNAVRWCRIAREEIERIY